MNESDSQAAWLARKDAPVGSTVEIPFMWDGVNCLVCLTKRNLDGRPLWIGAFGEISVEIEYLRNDVPCGYATTDVIPELDPGGPVTPNIHAYGNGVTEALDELWITLNKVSAWLRELREPK